MPIIPKSRNKILDKILTKLALNLDFRNLPKKRARRLLKTIPQIEPSISVIL